MAAWPTLFVASGASGAVVIAATASKARRLASETTGLEPEFIVVEEVPLGDPVKVLRIPRGALPGSSPAPALVAPTEEPVAPARRGDPETATKAAAAARRLGPNRRTEVLRDIAHVIRDGGSHLDGGQVPSYAEVGFLHGITESEYTKRFGGVPGGNSKRLGELVSGAWLYARGERPSLTTGSPQRVLFPTSGALQWVQENPA